MTKPTLTVIHHNPDVRTKEQIEDLVETFAEERDKFVCFYPKTLDKNPHNVIGKIPCGKRTVVFVDGQSYSEGPLDQTAREIMYHPYQGQNVVIMTREEKPHLVKMADTYVDLCGLNSFSRQEKKRVPEVY